MGIEKNRYVKRAVKHNDKKDIGTLRLEPKTLDEAISGVRIRNGKAHLVYSYVKLVRAFMKHECMDEIDAIEWIDYNTIRALPYMRGPGVAEPIVTEPS